LSKDVIEAIEYMKSWQKAGLISDKRPADAGQMLRDLKERAVKLGSGCSELGSNMSAQLG